MLLSNGLPYSKIRLKKFDFSPIDTPANIAKKLPPQRCSKPLLIPFFNFSHKWPTFAFTPESGYTLGFRRKIAHSGPHGETGAFPPPATVRLCAASEIFLFRHAFIYIHFPVLCEPSLSATVLSQTIFHRVFQPFAQTAHVRFHSRKRVHTRLSEKNRTQRLTRRNRGVSDRGCYHYPRSVPHVHKHPRAGCQNGKLCRFWGLDLVYSRRTQRACGTAMRLCASLSRGVAAPLGCVIFFAFVEIAACMPCAQSFPRVRGGGGITTIGVLCVLPKRRTSAYQSGSFVVF